MSKQPSFYVFNIGALLLLVSIIGSTLNFIAISATLTSWLHARWLEYTSILEERQSVRLAATTKAAEIRRRKQIADVYEAIGERVIVLLKAREDELAAREKRIKVREEELYALQKKLEDREKEVKVAEEGVDTFQKDLKVREKTIKVDEETLHASQKKLEERERKLKAAEEDIQKIQQQQEFKRKEHIDTQSMTTYNPIPPPSTKIILPAYFYVYAADLEGHFTCIGTTQAGRRCRQYMISNADKSAATWRLAKMQSSDPGDTFKYKALRELADWMLCPRWHRDRKPQGEEIASSWYEDLREARRTLKNQTQMRTDVSPAQTSLAFGTPSSSFSSSSGVPSLFSGNSNESVSSSGSTQPAMGSGFSAFACGGFQSIVPTGRQSGSPFGSTQPDPQTMTAAGLGGSFSKPTARNLTPVFGSMAAPYQ